MAYSRIEEQSSHIEELSYQIEELSSKLEPEVSACVSEGKWAMYVIYSVHVMVLSPPCMQPYAWNVEYYFYTLKFSEAESVYAGYIAYLAVYKLKLK